MARYIDVDNLLKRLDHAGAICGFGRYIITNEPAADVAPVVHGHWTEKRFPGGGFWDYSFVCSHCHHETPVRGYSIAPDYCPNCGAKMDEKDGEENVNT